NKPYDWLLPDQELRASEIPLLIGQNAFPNGLVLDTRSYTPLTDLSPALASDSDAGGMQHMAVAKDYGLPAGP
ncbi:MAG TPA: endonuclease, partial [Myxococcales bacterium]|nr:endonuclease [Myxococcales bacterium]